MTAARSRHWLESACRHALVITFHGGRYSEALIILTEDPGSSVPGARSVLKV